VSKIQKQISCCALPAVLLFVSRLKSRKEFTWEKSGGGATQVQLEGVFKVNDL